MPGFQKACSNCERCPDRIRGRFQQPAQLLRQRARSPGLSRPAARACNDVSGVAAIGDEGGKLDELLDDVADEIQDVPDQQRPELLPGHAGRHGLAQPREQDRKAPGWGEGCGWHGVLLV